MRDYALLVIMAMFMFMGFLAAYACWIDVFVRDSGNIVSIVMLPVSLAAMALLASAMVQVGRERY